MGRDRGSRPEARALRLFVAIEMPEAVRALVETAVAPIRAERPRARWVPPENQHVTLKFLGSTWPRLVDWVVESIAEVATASQAFETRVDGVGAFPNERRARVLWGGLEDTTGRLADLAGALDRALEREFPSEKRAFTPHLTVARFDPPERLPALDTGLRSEPFRVDRLILFRSHLRRPAPVYEPVEAFALGG
jgi:RNA 2',3'-cyclic 3'-phosphodiesterase